MELTVKDVLQLSYLKDNVALVAGKNGLNRIVKYVGVMEVPDYADGQLIHGQLILTTMYGFNEQTIFNTIGKLEAKHAAGIIIKLKRFVREVPPEVIRLADDLNFPVFSCQDIMFSEAISQISSKIINNEFSKMRTVNEQYRDIFTSMLNREPVDKFIIRQGKRLGYSCAFITPSGRIMAEYLHNKSSSAEHELFLQLGFNIAEDPVISESMMYREGGCYIFPCVFKKIVYAFFVIHLDRDIDELDTLLSSQIANYITLSFIENRAAQADQRLRISTIMSEIIYGQSKQSKDIEERLYLLGYRSSKAFCVLWLPVNDVDGADTDLILRCCDEQLSGSLPCFFPDGLMVLMPISDDSRRMILPDNKKTGYKIARAFGTLGLKCKIGCSSLQKDYSKIAECVKQAKEALNFSIAFESEEPLCCYDSYAEISAIGYILGTDGEKSIYDTIISPIQSYDLQYNQELWDTLCACMTNKTIEASAKALNIHSSTLRYRMQNINNITGLDFFSSNGRYALQTAFLISKLRGN